MAFYNEKMTQEMRHTFEKRKVFPDSNRVANPLYQTIDRENHMCLWCVGILDRDDPDHHYFLFEREGKTDLLLLQYLNPSKGTVIWIPSYYDAFPDKDVLWKKDFMNALTTFGISGNIEPSRDYTLTIDLDRIDTPPSCFSQENVPLWKKVFSKRIVWEIIILIFVLILYGIIPK